MLRVRVPATTANLGAGFDCLGLALSLFNEVEAETADELDIRVEGEGAAELPADATNLVWRAAQRVFEHVSHAPRGARLRLRNAIPLESGLGSSAAATVAGLMIGNALVGAPLDEAALLDLAVTMEGHPDNVAPALLGGLVVAGQADSARLLVERVAIPALTVVVVMPSFRLSTALARQALPASVPMADAVFNLSHTALTLLALQRGDYAALIDAMTDRLHQPYRAPLAPGLAAALDAARARGAAAAISGAGPAVIAFPASRHAEIGEAMRGAFVTAGLGARVWLLQAARGASLTTA